MTRHSVQAVEKTDLHMGAGRLGLTADEGGVNRGFFSCDIK